MIGYTMWYLSVIIASVFHLAMSSDKFRTFILDVEDITEQMAETTVLNGKLKEDLHRINETNKALQETNTVLEARVDEMNGTIISLQQQLTGKGSTKKNNPHQTEVNSKKGYRKFSNKGASPNKGPWSCWWGGAGYPDSKFHVFGHMSAKNGPIFIL